MHRLTWYLTDVSVLLQHENPQIESTGNTFERIEVAPFKQLFSPSVEDLCGGPSWPNFTQRTFERHCRFGRAIDLETSSVGQDHVLPVLRGHYTWIGPVVGHFGHQVAEFSHRILPSLHSRGQSPLLIAGRSRHADAISPVNSHWHYPTVSDFPNFVKEVMGWLGVNLNNVTVINDTVHVERLSVFPQGEQLGRPPASWYLDLLDELSKTRRVRENRRLQLYVSRAGLRFGKIAGEKYLEEFLTECGMRVIRPEEISFDEQLSLYRAANFMLFSEGSAIHSLGLLGRGLGQVIVLQRRQNFDHVWRAETEGRVERFESIDAIDTMFPTPESETAITCIDPHKFLYSLSQTELALSPSFSFEKFHDAALRDLADFRNDLGDRRFGLGVAQERVAFEQGRIHQYEAKLRKRCN